MMIPLFVVADVRCGVCAVHWWRLTASEAGRCRFSGVKKGLTCTLLPPVEQLRCRLLFTFWLSGRMWCFVCTWGQRASADLKLQQSRSERFVYAMIFALTLKKIQASDVFLHRNSTFPGCTAASYVSSTTKDALSNLYYARYDAPSKSLGGDSSWRWTHLLAGN